MKANFIGIGPEKSGSTSLFHYLKQHPDIFLSPLKNTKFFITDWNINSVLKEHYSYTYADFVAGRKFPPNFVTEEAEYEKYFNDVTTELAIGEITPSYISLSESPKLIYHYNPEIKLIAVLRNPVERALSQFYFHKSKGIEHHRSIFSAIDKEDTLSPLKFTIKFREKGKRPYSYIRQGLYYENISRYLKYFDMDQIKIVLFEDLINDANNVMRDICNFLGVDESYNFNTATIHNKTSSFSSWLIRTLNDMDGNIIARLPRFAKTGYNRLDYFSKFVPRKGAGRKLSNEEYNKLEDYFIEDTLRLEKLINRDLSHWYAKR